MAYHVHQTEAIVLDSYDLADASKSLLVYTRELGLLYMRAQGLRRLESKLRYGLQTLSIVHIGVVRGKAGWRVVDAAPMKSFAGLLRDNTRRRIVLHVCSLLRRLIDEGAHEKVFDLFQAMLRALDTRLGEEHALAIENVSVLLILHELGYVADLPEGIDAQTLTDANQLGEVWKGRAKLARHINAVLRETQL